MKGLRFRRSIKIAPGVRWNIGAKSSSLSFGPRGAKLTVGTHGTRATAGIPGTGLSVTRLVGSINSRAAPPSSQPDPSSFDRGLQWDDTLCDRMGITRSNDTSKRRWRVTGTLLVVAAIGACFAPNGLPFSAIIAFAGVLVFAIGAALPSSAQRAIIERTHRIREVGNMEFDESSRASLEQLAAKRDALGLLPTEVPEVERLIEIFERRAEVEQKRREELERHKAFVEQVQASDGAIPSVAGHERIVGGDVCYFAGSALYDKRGPNDEIGTLYLTNRRALFAGDSRTESPWSKVSSVYREDDTAVLIQRRDRQTPHCFVLDSLGEALRAEFIGTVCQHANTK